MSSIFDDIDILLTKHKEDLDWYISAKLRVESDIMHLWNNYFLNNINSNNSTNLPLLDEKFKILINAINYFSQCIIKTEKKLDELEKQRYSIIRKDDSIN